MIEYPYMKFVLLSGEATVGKLIQSEADEYQHIDLITDQLLPLSAEARRSLTQTMIAGWILGDGSERKLVVAPDESLSAAMTALDALSQWASDHDLRLVPTQLEVAAPQPTELIDVGGTIRRVLGLHALSASEVSSRIGVSAQALSEIQRSNRRPSLTTLQKISDFFEITTDRVLNATFDDLLRNELSDTGRFRRVEAKIAEGRTN